MGHNFTNRLSDLRRDIRRRLVAYGVLAVASGGVAAFVTVIFLDWALGLPPTLRLVGGLLFVLGFVTATYFWVIKPLRARVTMEEVAWRLEQRFPELRDQLLTAVELSRQPAESGPMADYTIARAEEAVAGLTLKGALTNRPLLARAAAFSAAAACLVILVALVPGWIHTGTARYSSPWGQTQWPKSVQIVPITQDVVVPVGESAQVAMLIERGLTPRLRPVVHLRDDAGKTETIALQRQVDGQFTTTIESITENLRYWFEAGDDDSSASAGRLITVRRPQVVSATATIQAPPYAATGNTRIADLARGTVDATVGSKVLLSLQTNKPLPSGQSGLRADSGEFLPLGQSSGQNTLVTELEVGQDLALYPELRDEYGFSNHGASVYRIRALPDRPPTATVVDPKGTLEVTPQAEIGVKFSVTDDFGVRDVLLVWELEGASQSQTIDLSIAAASRQHEGIVYCDGWYSWALAPLRLKPGDTVQYHIAAADNRILPEEPDPQQGVSATRQLRIIAEAELINQLREDMLVVESQLRQVSLHQEAIRDRTEEISRTLEPVSGLERAELDALQSLSGRQQRLAGKAHELVERLATAGRRLALNNTAESELETLIEDAAASLKQAAEGSMPSAARSLESVTDLAPPQQSETLVKAREDQAAALEQLQAVGRKLSQWGSFQSLVAAARELLDRQTDVRDDTAQVGRSLMGKQFGSLTEEERNSLRELERRQRQIVADLQQHLAQMREHRQGISQRDPAGADTIDAALRADRANATSDHAESAAEAISENRTAAAGIEQRATVESMRKLIAALQERQKRELEELRKRVAEAEEQIAWLIEHQKALLKATMEAGLVGADRDIFASLAEQQRTLAQNTTFAADDVAAADRTAPISELVERATEPMRAAADNLAEASAESAAKTQQDAIELLEEALAELQKLADAASEEWLRHSLSRIHDHLAAMLDGQRAVDRAISELRGEMQSEPKLNRAQARRATQLAREQADMRALLGQVLPDLQAVPVYAWALDRVAKWMDAASNRLIARQIDGELADTSIRIVRELEKLVQAIIDTQALPMGEEFMEAEGAAGGSHGQQKAGPPVPTVAELLVLKAMQHDVAARTAEFSTTFDPGETSEEQLKSLSQLGEDQAELRRLTQLVTEKARTP